MWGVQITVPFLKVAKQGEILSKTDLEDLVDSYSFSNPSDQDEDQRMIVYAKYNSYWGKFGRVIEEEEMKELGYSEE